MKKKEMGIKDHLTNCFFGKLKEQHYGALSNDVAIIVGN